MSEPVNPYAPPPLIRREALRAKATPAQTLEAACPLCSAEPGQPCDGSYYNFFLLGIFLTGFGRIHVRRYQAAISAEGGSRP